jgi:hypothetical protein
VKIRGVLGFFLVLLQVVCAVTLPGCIRLPVAATAKRQAQLGTICQDTTFVIKADTIITLDTTIQITGDSIIIHDTLPCNDTAYKKIITTRQGGKLWYEINNGKFNAGYFGKDSSVHVSKNFKQHVYTVKVIYEQYKPPPKKTSNIAAFLISMLLITIILVALRKYFNKKSNGTQANV